jgi:Dolichyl-phosphate-mannose-protein mannosyltransferase
MFQPVHKRCWPRRWLLWIAAGLALRLLFIYFPRPGDDDTNDYLELGHNLLHHGIYGMTEGSVISPSTYRVPGYPIFLAVYQQLFSHFWPNGWWNAVYFTQTATDLLGGILLALFARRFLSPRAAEIALALAMLCPFTAVYCGIPLTESFSIFAVALGIYAAGRALAAETSGTRDYFALILAGLAAALAMLLRPDGLVLLVALGAGIFWYVLRISYATPRAQSPFRRAFSASLLCSVVALLPLVPWTIRNAVQFHVFQPLAPRYADPGEPSIAGARSWLRTWTIEYVSTANVCWNFPGDTIDLADIPSRAYDSPEERAQTIALINEYNRETVLTPHLEVAFTALANERIHANLFRYYVELPLLRLADMLLRPRTEAFYLDVFWWRWSEHPGQTIVSTLLGLINFAYIAAAVIGFVRRRVPWPLMLAAYFVLRCLLLAIMENPEPRYTLVFFPVFILAAAATFEKAASHWNESLPRQRAGLQGRVA